MQILGLSLLCLTLALLSDTGIGQSLGNLPCSDCGRTVQGDTAYWLTYAVKMRVQSHKKCQGSTIKFTGKKGDDVAVMCAYNNLQWVKDITECLDKGEKYSEKFSDCRDCKLIVPNDEQKWQITANKLGVQSHDKCSDSIIRFKLKNDAVLCGNNTHQWVQNVIKSLDKDPKKDSFKGASVNPSTATQSPTTIPVTMVMTPTASAENPEMTTSREATEMTRTSKPSVANNGKFIEHEENVTNLLPSNSNRGTFTTPAPTTLNPTTTPKVTVLMTTTTTNTAKNPDIITPREIITTTSPSNGSIEEFKGVKSSNGPLTENKSEINQMKTTIISLVFIVLVMVAAGTGIFCYKKKLPCLEKPIQYTQAPSQDTLEMGTTTT